MSSRGPSLNSLRSTILRDDPSALTANSAGSGSTHAHATKYTDLGRAAVAGPSTAPPAAAPAAIIPDSPFAFLAGPAVDLNAPLKPLVPKVVDVDKAYAKLVNSIRALAVGAEGVDDVLKNIYQSAAVQKDNTNAFVAAHQRQVQAQYEAYTLLHRVPPHMRWRDQIVMTLSPGFIRARAMTARGRSAERIKAQTLLGIAVYLVSVIVKYCRDADDNRAGVIVLTKGQLFTKLMDEVESLIRELDLDRYRDPVSYWGVHELRLLIEEILGNTENMGRMSGLQLICLLVIGFYTALRPGSLLCSHKDYLPRKRYLTLKHIRITRTGRGLFRVVVDIRTLKGNESGAHGDRAEFVLDAVTKSHNVMFEAPLYIVCYLHQRGALGPVSLVDLILGEHTEVPILPEFWSRPFFCAIDHTGNPIEDKPAMIHYASDSIRSLARNAGLPPGGTLYAFRRGTGNDIGNKIGLQYGSMVLRHNDMAASKTFGSFYSRNTANLPMVGLLLGDYDHELGQLARDKAHLHDRSADAVIAMIGRGVYEREAEESNISRKTQRGTRTIGAPEFNENELRYIKDAEDQCWDKIDVVYRRLLACLGERHPRLRDTLDRGRVKLNFASLANRSEVLDQAKADAAVKELDELYKLKIDAHRNAVKAMKTVARKRQIYALDAARAEIDTVRKRDETVAGFKQPSHVLADALEHLQGPLADAAAALGSADPDPDSGPEDIAPPGDEIPHPPADDADEDAWRDYVTAAMARVDIDDSDHHALAETYKHLPLAIRSVVHDAVFEGPPPADKGGDEGDPESTPSPSVPSPPLQPEDDLAAFRSENAFNDSDEHEQLNLDMLRLRLALATFVVGPIERRRAIEAKFRQANGMWECDQCGQEHKSYSNIKHHVRIHTAWYELVQHEIESERSGPKARRWACPTEDGHAFGTKDKLIEHLISGKCADGERHRTLLRDHIAVVAEDRQKPGIAETKRLRALYDGLPPSPAKQSAKSKHGKKGKKRAIDEDEEEYDDDDDDDDDDGGSYVPEDEDEDDEEDAGGSYVDEDEDDEPRDGTVDDIELLVTLLTAADINSAAPEILGRSISDREREDLEIAWPYFQRSLSRHVNEEKGQVTREEWEAAGIVTE